MLSTASPYKFAKDVYSALEANQHASDTEALKLLSVLTGTDIPSPLESVLHKEILHPDIIERDGMDKAVTDFASL